MIALCERGSPQITGGAPTFKPELAMALRPAHAARIVQVAHADLDARCDVVESVDDLNTLLSVPRGMRVGATRVIEATGGCVDGLGSLERVLTHATLPIARRLQGRGAWVSIGQPDPVHGLATDSVHGVLAQAAVSRMVGWGERIDE